MTENELYVVVGLVFGAMGWAFGRWVFRNDVSSQIWPDEGEDDGDRNASESIERPKPEDWARIYSGLEIDGSGLEAMRVLSEWVLDQSGVAGPLPMTVIAACDAVGTMPRILRAEGTALFARENKQRRKK